MGKSVTQKIIEDHLVSGEPKAGNEIAIRIDQTLTQDATGTMAYLQFEAMGIPRVRTKVSVSYVDHNMLQAGFENADDHRFLQSMAAKYGIYFSRPGNGICHQVHLERFGVPGGTLLGSDSHTPTSGGLGMIAMGAGGLDVAVAMGGGPIYLTMPKVVRVELKGELQPWVTGKDVILEMLRRLTVKGGVGRIFEYGGEGVVCLEVPERATITNMGAELGATTSLFPSDERTREYLRAQRREEVWAPLAADPDAEYDDVVEIDLNTLEPLIAQPHSPDSVVPVKEIAGTQVSQVCIGSCTNSSYRDLMTVAGVLRGKTVSPELSATVTPGSRQVFNMIARNGALAELIQSGFRILESGCGPCIGMGQAPPSGGVSVRTFNRNFVGRSGTPDAKVYLCSPEVAAATALKGVITDPRDLGERLRIETPAEFSIDDDMIIPPSEKPEEVEIIRGPNIQPLPLAEPVADPIEAPVLLKVGDNITTDHILPAGARILPLRSNIPAISEFVFERIDPSFAQRAKEAAQPEESADEVRDERLSEMARQAAAQAASIPMEAADRTEEVRSQWYSLRVRLGPVAQQVARIDGSGRVLWTSPYDSTILGTDLSETRGWRRMKETGDVVIDDSERLVGAAPILSWVDYLLRSPGAGVVLGALPPPAGGLVLVAVDRDKLAAQAGGISESLRQMGELAVTGAAGLPTEGGDQTKRTRAHWRGLRVRLGPAARCALRIGGDGRVLWTSPYDPTLVGLDMSGAPGVAQVLRSGGIASGDSASLLGASPLLAPRPTVSILTPLSPPGRGAVLIVADLSQPGIADLAAEGAAKVRDERLSKMARQAALEAASLPTDGGEPAEEIRSQWYSLRVQLSSVAQRVVGIDGSGRVLWSSPYDSTVLGTDLSETPGWHRVQDTGDIVIGESEPLIGSSPLVSTRDAAAVLGALPAPPGGLVLLIVDRDQLAAQPGNVSDNLQRMGELAVTGASALSTEGGDQTERTRAYWRGLRVRLGAAARSIVRVGKDRRILWTSPYDPTLLGVDMSRAPGVAQVLRSGGIVSGDAASLLGASPLLAPRPTVSILTPLSPPGRGAVLIVADLSQPGIAELLQHVALGRGGFVVVGGSNYGQGSSREHAALAPMYLGLKAVIAKSFARIHLNNLINFGIVPLTFATEADYDQVEQGDDLELAGLADALKKGQPVTVRNVSKGREFKAAHTLTPRQADIVLAGGLLNWVRKQARAS
jgi:aconitate hydratase